MIRTLTALAAIAFVAAGSVCAAAAVVAEPVQTSEGVLIGTSGTSFTRYAGIRYAAPPVGELRWRAPQPPPKWSGQRNADTFGGSCPQPAQFLTSEMPKISEDCLFLNIWVPAGARSGNKLPVLFWVHGGGWETGSGWLPDDYGEQFTNEGVIFVTVNYRLGRLGTFAHPLLTAQNKDGGLLANYGLLDNIAALKWVRANIAAFGGNPDNVTVMGTSAGGGTVNQLMASRLARGLFVRGIAQSAGVSRSASYLNHAHPNGTPSAEEVGKEWGHAVNADDLDSLRKLPLSVLAGPGPHAGFGTIVDGRIITEQIADLFAEGKIAHVDYLAGAASFEGWVFQILKRPVDQIYTNFGDRADFVRKLYLADGADDKDTASYRLAGDLFLAFPSILAAVDTANHDHEHRTYAYYFDYVAENLRPRAGAFHGGDTFYTFDTFTPFHPLHDKVTPSALDKQVASQFHQYWVNFIKTGNPNGPGLPAWPRFAGLSSRVLYVSPEGVRIEEHPLRAKYKEAGPVVAAAKLKF
jgi:para-nitrobenzyl esterase